jgi:hypothetical protein
LSKENTMKIQKLHKYVGLALLLPFLGWILTGVVFLIKPGYAAAYERLHPKFYPLEEVIEFQPSPDWQAIQIKKTVLGKHLLVMQDGSWLQLDWHSLEPLPRPSDTEIMRLLQDAVAQNAERYGVVESVAENVFETSTGVELTLDWHSLTIQQRGRDTRFIGALYKIHYLQWSGLKTVDLVLGVLGLFALLIVVVCGVVLWRRPKHA